jgi:tetratricopeptide (TPR) repeat protein
MSEFPQEPSRDSRTSRTRRRRTLWEKLRAYADPREVRKTFRDLAERMVGEQPVRTLMRDLEGVSFRKGLQVVGQRLFGKDPMHQMSADMRRVRWYGTLAVIVGLGLIAAGFFGGVRFYHRWRQGQLVERAQEALRREDLRGAALTARRVLQLNPANLEATRIMAGLADRLGYKDAVGWWERIAILDPSTENSLAWAVAALKYNDLEGTSRALLSVRPSQRSIPEFHELAAGLALSVGNLPLAEFHFSRAFRQRPSDQNLKFNLACIRLQALDPTIAAKAMATVEEFRAQPRHRAEALRALFADAVRRKDRDRAFRLAQELQGVPGADFRDKLQYLEILRRMKSPEFGPYLAKLQQECLRNTPDMARLIAWMNDRRLAAEALEWVRRLPADTLARQPIPVAVAGSHEAQRGWKDLEGLLTKGEWGDLDFIRLGLLAHLNRQNRDGANSRIQWGLAVAKAGERPEALGTLARLAEGWGWTREAEELYWKLGGGASPQRWALQSLYRQYRLRGDTEGLYRVLARTLEADPSDLVAKNNLAILSLLLGREVDKALGWTTELYEKSPTNAMLASSHAFALHKSGRTAEGLKVFEKLREEQLRNPTVAAYYGVLLASSGQADKARRFLDLAARATLLPEEQRLVADARHRARAP